MTGLFLSPEMFTSSKKLPLCTTYPHCMGHSINYITPHMFCEYLTAIITCKLYNTYINAF